MSTKWGVSFVVDSNKFAGLMEVLIPMKVQDLEFKIVAGTAKRIRKGDKTAAQIVAELATPQPQPRSVFTEALKGAGFVNVHTGLDQALKQKLVRRSVVRGHVHYRSAA